MSGRGSKKRATGATAAVGNIEMGNIIASTTNTTGSSNPNRIATERIQDYASVDNGHEDADSASDASANGDLNNNSSRRGRHRRRRPPGGNGTMSSSCSKTGWIAFVCVLASLAISLLIFQRASSKQQHASSSSLKHQASLSSSSGSVSKTAMTPVAALPVHYDLNLMTSAWNPFDLQSTTSVATSDGNKKSSASATSSSAASAASILAPLHFPWSSTNNNHKNSATNADTTNDDMDIDDLDAGGAYLMQPDVVNDTLVFIAEGDLYMTRLFKDKNKKQSSSLSAMKLTTTIGNIRTPKLHPTLPLVAFTATYTGRREVYLQDWRSNGNDNNNNNNGRVMTTRLTYWDNSYGVSKVVGWKDEKTLLLAAASTAVSLPDVRLYELTLAQEDLKDVVVASAGTTGSQLQQQQTQQQQPVVMEITPVPLAQALEGFYHRDEGDADADDCLYFTRFQQSSHTIRYIGGTAENLWMHCSKRPTALPITPNYNGTSKNPTLYYDNIDDKHGNDHEPYILFLSDRSSTANAQAEWTPTTMNLWALPLPSSQDAYVDQNLAALIPFPVTSISCQFHGRSLQEFSVDPVTNNVILRIGADLYQLTASQVHSVLSAMTALPSLPKPTRLDIAVYSDFHELQERIIPVNIVKHLTNVDVFETPVVVQKSTNKHALAALFTLRGQAFVAPVLRETKASAKIPYQGSGQNLPYRRYRVAPGTFTAGAMRILNSLALPILVNQDDDDDNNDDSKSNNGSSSTATTKNTRWAILLATDPLSPTAEHAFYMIRIDTGAPNAFADLDHLPEPFLGGHTITGGSTANGGLGSVWRDSLTISPCGRRMAWTDTDNRICVMTIPLYQDKTAAGDYKYTILPKENELGEPMYGHSETKLSWSPGGRYLAVHHLAGNQFFIISIVDCGDPAAPPQESNNKANTSTSGSSSSMIGKVAEIQIGRIVQATPSRFNAIDPYWGTTTADAEILEYRKLLAQLIPNNGDAASSSSSNTALEELANSATTIYFLTDRNIVSDVDNPFGSRVPLPHFPLQTFVYALPLTAKSAALSNGDSVSDEMGRFSGGGAMEVMQDELDALTKVVKQLLLAKEAESAAESGATGGQGSASRKRRLGKVSENLARALIARGHNAKTGRREAVRMLLNDNDDNGAATTNGDGGTLEDVPALIPGDSPTVAPSSTNTSSTTKSPFPVDMDIDFGPRDLTFARQAYRVPQVPMAKYSTILSQAADDGSLILVESTDEGAVVKVFMTDEYPADSLEEVPLPFSPFSLLSYGMSTCRKYIILILGPDGATKIIPNTISGLSGAKSDMTGGAPTGNIADVSGLALSVWPALEYKQMFNDAWRMYRDYFYDTDLHGVDWPQMHKRYSSLVKRCTKREDLDDVLIQLSSELSALHVFVYGGEYNAPFAGDLAGAEANTPASLGASFQRKAEWKGYMITEIPQRDPDFNMVEAQTIYSPLSNRALRPTGQQGLEVGDVIVGVNGESALRVPDIHMLLRGQAGQSVRLEVLRLASRKQKNVTDDEAITPEPVIVVPLTQADADNLRYAAWEWKTRIKAKTLAKDAGFTVGYVHLRSMERDDMDAFARSFFEDYDKQTFILDVRHNRGGNIDSWISTLLQRKAWNYFASRNTDGRFRTGDNDWNQHFAFRGHIVLLIDEKTSSDGEGISRSLSELGLCRLIGTRTWGGGIWLSSDNHLVDGGIATAPEIGTFNEKRGWGTGVEMTGVSPDVEVDNNPRTAYDGVDTQLETAIAELKRWLQTEPIVEPKFPGPRPDMSLKGESCPA